MLDTSTAEQIYLPLRARAYELTGLDQAADDLTQETLLRLLERPPAYVGTVRQTLRYARLTMRSIFVSRFLGCPRRARLSVVSDATS